MINSVVLTFRESLLAFNHCERFLRFWGSFVLLAVQVIIRKQGICIICKSDKPSKSWWIYLGHLYIIEKGGVQEQSSMEYLFEYLRYDHRLKRIVSCFLGMMQPCIWNSLSSMLSSMSFLGSVLCSTVSKAFFKANLLCSNEKNVIYFLIVIFHTGN